MKTNNWFLKGLKKYGRTERFPRDNPENLFKTNENIESPRFKPFKRFFFISLSHRFGIMRSM